MVWSARLRCVTISYLACSSVVRSFGKGFKALEAPVDVAELREEFVDPPVGRAELLRFAFEFGVEFCEGVMFGDVQ